MDRLPWWMIDVWSIPGLVFRIAFSSIICGIHFAKILLIPSSLWIVLNTVPKVYPVLIVLSLIVIRRPESNSSLTVSIFFVEMDKGAAWPQFISNRIIPLLKLTVPFIQSSFSITLFPKAVLNISNVSCLDILFVTQNLNADRCSKAAILLIWIICVTASVRRWMASNLVLWRH